MSGLEPGLGIWRSVETDDAGVPSAERDGSEHQVAVLIPGVGFEQQRVPDDSHQGERGRRDLQVSWGARKRGGECEHGREPSDDHGSRLCPSDRAEGPHRRRVAQAVGAREGR